VCKVISLSTLKAIFYIKCQYYYTVPRVYVTLSGSGGTPVVGQPYTLSCSVSGDEKLKSSVTYQWMRYDDNVETPLVANSENLSFSSLNLSNSGNYSCRVIIRSRYLDNNITANSNLISIILQGK
jgi:hypothetical protein